MTTGQGGRRSIYDGDEDDEADDAPWFLRSAADEDDEAPAPAHLDGWRAAERDLLRPLAGVARLHGRLEQALTLQGGGARLALIEAADLLWLEGVRIRPERLSMYRADRGVEAVTERADYALGLWAAERLAGEGALADEAGLERFLGRRRVSRADAAPPAPPGRAPAGAAAARADWLAAWAAAADLHPLTQAARLADLWRRDGPGGREAEVEATVIAARLATAGGETGALAFAPLAIGGRRRIAGRAGGPAAILARFLEAAEGGARRALLELGRMADWRARAAAAPLKKNPAALIGLLDREYAVTTGMAEAHLGAVRQTALTSLNILRDHGLVREVTGGKSFFYWTADLTPDRNGARE